MINAIELSDTEVDDIVSNHLLPRSNPFRHYCERKNGEMCDMCDAYDARKQSVAQGKVPAFYVVATGVSRLYGGPEEGGWYYDAQQILAVRKVYTVAGALKAARELREEYPKPRYSRHSVLGGEDTYIETCYSEDMFPEETKGRPHYE